MTPHIDLECHVQPLLTAIEWIGQASHKLAELEAIAGGVPEVKRWFRGINNPDPINAGELISEVSWVARDLVRMFNELEGKSS
ncbi:hypothetical protein [Aquabacterium sp. A08]|uniref:hypothetical protein n=1 Tax=Aquabacterium sp. A08 TaxID=2718532 RepID=UPI00141E7C04|nr:hypothetical protein [Aquabacterium sp. A08]NIC43110.1 hypothetical protein [Aquabacterium sp. A08]